MASIGARWPNGLERNRCTPNAKKSCQHSMSGHCRGHELPAPRFAQTVGTSARGQSKFVSGAGGTRLMPGEIRFKRPFRRDSYRSSASRFRPSMEKAGSTVLYKHANSQSVFSFRCPRSFYLFARMIFRSGLQPTRIRRGVPLNPFRYPASIGADPRRFP